MIKLGIIGVVVVFVGGIIVYYFFRMDVNCKCYLEKGILDYKIVRDIEVLLIDEFSMLEFNVFYVMDKIIREVLIFKNC